MGELIDNYLLGLLSEAERKAFELRLASEPNLAAEVNVQRDLMQAAKLQGLKADISNAYRQVRLGKMIKTAVITTLIAAVVGLGIYYITKSISQKNEQKTIGATLPSNDFTIDNTKDTVIETANGIILHIPANAFGDIDNYELEVKEVLNALDIMEAGLSTMSDSNLLATAGMFKITATKEGKEIQLVDGKEITAQVPTDEVDPDIMLFDGVEDSTGNVNWVNPTKIKKHLITRSFDELNFYPSGYLAKVAENGYDRSNKKFTDSMYWSFDCGVESEATEEYAGPIVTESWMTCASSSRGGVISQSLLASFNSLSNKEKTNELQTKLIADNGEWKNIFNNFEKLFGKFQITEAKNWNYLGLPSPTEKAVVIFNKISFESWLYKKPQPRYLNLESIVDSIDTPNKQICPTSIKALQTKRFEKTYIATKEFEQRLQHLFQVCDEASLNVYIHNLDKDISYADSIVALRIEGSKKEVFQRFAAQKLGNTKSASPAFAKLAAYHKKKKNAYDEAARKARKKVLSKYAKEDKKQEYRTEEKQLAELQGRAENYTKELETNMVEAYRQAGIVYPSPPLPKGSYIVPITTTGWKNLDQYVTASTNTRTSLKTKYNGKDISIEYHSLNVTITKEETFDFVNVYLIPNKLPSYQKLKKKDNLYFESINELFNYELVCLAKKGSDYFVYSDLLEKKDTSKTVTLKRIDKKELHKLLKSTNKSTANRNVGDDLAYEEQNFLYNKNLQKRKKKEALRREIEGIIWPCGVKSISCNEDRVEEGYKLFEANCASCHALKGKVVGPALAGVVDKYEEDYDWLIAFTKNNQKLITSGDARAKAIYEEYNGAAMNVFENLSDDQIMSILSYIDCESGNEGRVPVLE